MSSLIVSYPAPTVAPNRSLGAIGLNAAITGSANRTVAFVAGSDVNLGVEAISSWALRVSDGLAGTSWKIRRPGRYMAWLIVVPTQTGVAQGMLAAVTYDPPAAMLSGDPSPFDPSFAARDGDEVSDFPGGNGEAYALRGAPPITVTPKEARTAGLGIIRAQISDNANGPPALGTVVLTKFLMRIEQIAV